MSTDPYLLPGSGVLRNKLGICDNRRLAAAEFDLSYARWLELAEHPGWAAVHGSVGTIASVRAIHRRLFGDVYEWAGQLRTVDMSKEGGDPFFPVSRFPMAIGWFEEELAGDNLLAGMGQDRFAQRLAHHYGTLNVIHPFREGNGRTQRAYWSLVAAQAGWSIDWAAVSKAGNDRACAINLATGDETVLRELLEPAISRLNDDNDPFAKLQTGR